MTVGPGVMPWMMNAPMSSAMTGWAGNPRVRSGMNEVCAAALLADSGAATPSIAPWPKRCGVLLIRFSTEYEVNEASTWPPPGRMPSSEPMAVPRRTGATIFVSCSRDGLSVVTRCTEPGRR